MNDFMMQLAHASFQGGVIIAVIIALRFLLKKAPKSILCLLWLLAITRLLLPIQLESSLSLQPDIEIITQQEYPQSEILGQTPSQQVPAVPMETIQIGDGEIIHPTYSDSIITPEQPAVFDWTSVLPWIWLSVAAGLALWSILSYLQLRKRTKSAIVLDEGIWLSPELDSAFVLGYLKPQIYLPAKLNKQEQTLVISHERAHIRRFDHWYKLLGFITLCVHWFNPLVWLAYIFLCRDMEMACDEQVVRDMDTQQRKAYSMALLRCSADNHHFKPCPVAFAEVSVKDRIKGVLNYKKPGFWMTLVGIIAVVFVAVCFLTSPITNDNPIDHTLPETTQASLTDYSEQELRKKCIDIQQMLYGTVSSLETDKPIHLLVTWDQGGKNEFQRELLHCAPMDYSRTTYANSDFTQEWFYVAGDADSEYEFYERHYNTSLPWQTDSGWVLDKHATGMTVFIQWVTPEELQTASFKMTSDSSGFYGIFETSDEFDRTRTHIYHFDLSGSLVSITETSTYPDGSQTHTASIISTSSAEIKAKLDSIYAEAIAQPPPPTIPVQPETQAILDAVNQHLAFRDAILLGDITEIAEMDLALLKDELKHKQAVAADFLKRLGSEYVVTEILLNEDGSADALVTETVLCEMDDETLLDPTTDEIIVHMIHLDNTDGKYHVTEDAYREWYTNFNSRGFNAYELEQVQKRIVTKAIDQYFSWKKEVLAEGVTMIPEMRPIWLMEKLRHKQHLDNAGIQWIDSSYTIQEIKFWGREYADILLAETVTYSINGETKQETIQHEMGVMGVPTATPEVNADAYFEEFSGFRSNDYVGATIFPD